MLCLFGMGGVSAVAVYLALVMPPAGGVEATVAAKPGATWSQPSTHDIRLHLFSVAAAAMLEATREAEPRAGTVKRAEAAAAAGSPVAPEIGAVEAATDGAGKVPVPTSGGDAVPTASNKVAGVSQALDAPAPHPAEPSVRQVAAVERSAGEPGTLALPVDGVAAAAAVAAEAVSRNVPDDQRGVDPDTKSKAASSRADGQNKTRARQQAKPPGKAQRPAAAGVAAAAPAAERIQWRSVFGGS